MPCDAVPARPVRTTVFAALGVVAVGMTFASVAARARAQAPAQPVTAAWEAGPPPEGGWTVGDPIPLRLRVVYPDDVEVTLPELPQQWAAFEVRDQALLEPSTNDDGSVTAVREATVTLWSPGEHETPPFVIRARNADGEIDEVPVGPLRVDVVSVLAAGDESLRDLKPQATLAGPPKWPWLVAGAIAAGGLLLAARWLRRRWRRGGVEAETAERVDDRRPEEIAYGELVRIAALDLPVQGEFKHHYTLLTDCVRSYVEGMYGIPAVDRTTGELLRALRRSRMQRGAVTHLHDLLREADLVKFARLRPSIERARGAVADARHLIDITKPARTTTSAGIDDGGGGASHLTTDSTSDP